MSFISGPGVYKTALVAEIFANLSSLPSLFLFPDRALSYLVKGPAQITPATRSLIQLFGGVTLAITLPLVLSLPNPSPGSEGDKQIAVRRHTYVIMGAMEVALAGVMGFQYAMGADSGLTETALRVGFGLMGGFAWTRAFFLYAKPEWMETRETKTKTKEN